jgi:hypothetical protein
MQNKPMSDNYSALLDNICLPPKTLGDESISISIADFSVRIEGLEPDLKGRIAERYEGFTGLSGENEHFTATAAAGKECFISPTEDGYLRIEELDREDGFYFLSTDFSGFAHKENNCGFFLLADPADLKFSLLAVENYLMRVFSYLVLKKGGFFLHACGIARDEKAYIFYGPSGSGKSAVAMLSPELGVLSDDMVLIFKKNDVFYASSTPFWGAISRMMKIKGVFPLGGCFKISKTTETELEKMNTIKAMTTLFSSSLFGSFSSSRTGMLFENIKNFVRLNEVHQLDLPLKPVFWDMIKK